MLIYKKYIIKTTLYPLLALTCVLTSLVWITQILKLLPLIDKGVAFADFLNLIILFLPSLFFIISPLISVLAVIYVYSKLQEERQLVILKTSGLSNFSITKPALIIASIVTLISYYISLHLMPLSYNKLKYNLSNFRENYVSNIIDERTFNQISKYTTIYVDKKNKDGTLEGIILFDNKVPEQHSILFAKHGMIVMNDDVPVFRLKDGFRQSFDQNRSLTKLHFDDLLVEIKSDAPFEDDRNKTSLELYVQEMLWPKNELSSERKIRLRIDGHQRLIWPFFNYCLVFLALSMFLSRPYNRKSNMKQMAYTFIPLIIVAYFHFTFQKIAYQEPIYLFACYLNVFLCIIFSIWQSSRRKI
jgi:lipopolysaccharide export system permease protein